MDAVSFPPDRERVTDVITEAFRKIHHGRSADDVVLDDELNKEFVCACRRALPGLTDWELNWRLLGLRKAGKLGPVTTVRVRLTDYDDYIHAAEIAARLMEDKHDLTCDRIFCDPHRRAEFDRIAASVAPGYAPYKYRKAALKLRKNRRLPPEPMKRLAAFQRQVTIENASAYEEHPERIPRDPGVYAFLDDTGYLYIGETHNLHSRLKKHLDHSDSRSLAHYLWKHGAGRIKIQLFVFPKGSEGARAASRRAFEAALIASRAPRFNIQCR